MIDRIIAFLNSLNPAEFVTLTGVSVTFIGIIATLIVGVINLKYSSKQRFVSSVTKMRGEYLANIKQYISCFISECTKVMNVKENKKKDIDYQKLHEMYDLILLNISDTHPFDIKYQKCLSSIYRKMLSDYPSLAIFEMQELLKLSRRLVKMEWEGYKYEIKHGHAARYFAKKKLEKKFLYSSRNNDKELDLF